MMKKCIYQSKSKGWGKIQCKYTGAIRWECDLKKCGHFHPTLIYRLFGKWWQELR